MKIKYLLFIMMISLIFSSGFDMLPIISLETSSVLDANPYFENVEISMVGINTLAPSFGIRTRYDRFLLDFEYQAIIKIGKETPYNSGLNYSDYRVIDIIHKIAPSEANNSSNTSIYNNLNILNISAVAGDYQFTCGRFKIDLWENNPQNLNTVSFINHQGFDDVDGIVSSMGSDGFEISRGNMLYGSNMSVSFLSGYHIEKDRSAANLSIRDIKPFNFMDFGFLYSHHSGTDQFAFSTSSYFKTFQCLADMSYTMADGYDDYIRTTAYLGFEYSAYTLIDGQINFGYHFNGAGKDDALEYYDDIDMLNRENISLLGRNYLFIGHDHEFNRMLGFSNSYIYNIDDKSIWSKFELSGKIEKESNLTWKAGIMLGGGKKHIEMNNLKIPISEFGPYNDRIYIALDLSSF